MSSDLAQRQKILLTGGSGQVGWSLKSLLPALGDVYAPERSELDLTSTESIRKAIRVHRPRWIVNPAAYTAVDKAEMEPELVYAVNRDAVEVIAEEAKGIDAAVIHYSTDYVFDGASDTPYVEDDPTHPLGVYGRSKLEGEQALAASGVPHLIFRTSWVYGSRGKNFLLTILKLARERDELRIVGDQHGAPTSCGDLARMTSQVMLALQTRAQAQGAPIAETVAPLSGVYHACNSGDTTWYGFAAEAVRQAQSRQTAANYASLLPITTAEYPTPAKRPKSSRLNCEKLSRSFSVTMRPWPSALADVLSELGLESASAPSQVHSVSTR